MARKPGMIARPAAGDAPQRCTCCDRPLKGKIAWLELDQRSWSYHDFGDVPAEKSQGWFPFGITCATAKLNGR